MESDFTDINYDSLYLYAFYIAIAVVFVVEVVAPRRLLQQSFAVRWLNNIGLNMVSAYVLRFLTPIAGIELALRLEVQGVGLFNLFEMPFWFALIATVLLLDFLAYVVHRMFHRYLVFWRCHLVHHADLDVDFTTHVRHHPFESMISLAVTLSFMLLMGFPALGLLIYAILAQVVSLFSHGNIAVPYKLDRVLRCFIITPDMHRVHHSVDKTETNSNYGIVFPCWDRLFNTYVAQPKKGHLDMVLGLDRFRSPRDLYIDRMLLLPFSKQAVRRAKPEDVTD